ncbi:MAG TPA: hypothetical protein VD993_12000 [Chitinophagaceae bacterium]|nr:hypothetical protein [Chitinophagaceae bacterium]
MLLKVKSNVFIDRLTLEVDAPEPFLLQAVLRDDAGCVCSALETAVETQPQVFNWNGLNDLPYGVYSLEVKHGADETKMRLVKRV